MQSPTHGHTKRITQGCALHSLRRRAGDFPSTGGNHNLYCGFCNADVLPHTSFVLCAVRLRTGMPDEWDA